MYEIWQFTLNVTQNTDGNMNIETQHDNSVIRKMNSINTTQHRLRRMQNGR